MAIATELNSLGGTQIRYLDDTRGDLIPAGDLASGYGMFYGPGSTAAAPVKRRVPVNELLPVGLVMVQSTNGTERNTFTSRVSLLGTILQPCTIGGTQTAGTFPAGALNLVGRTVRIRAWGTLGTNGTPNYTFDVGLGAGVLATTGALAMTASTSPAPWALDVTATVQTAGATGVVIAAGTISMANASLAATKTFLLANSTPGTGLTADLTAALAFTTNITSGASDAANRCIQNGCIVEILY
jgi:hypothetical protein